MKHSNNKTHLAPDTILIFSIFLISCLAHDHTHTKISKLAINKLKNNKHMSHTRV